VSESTKIDRTTIAGISLLSGFVVLVMLKLAIILGFLRFTGAPPPPLAPSPTPTAANADDSPVTVRGGSVTIRDSQGFTCANQLCSATVDSSDKSVITLDRVRLDQAKPPQTYTLNPKMNWSLKLTFRQGSDGGGGNDPNHYLQVCSAPGCITNGPIVAGPLYLLADDPGDNTASAWGTQDNIDGSKGVPFHVTHCGGPSAAPTPAPGESPCNHIYSVVYTTIVTPNSPATLTTYYCKRGQCDIGIGNAVPSPAPPSK
jgi:hypothetical protein